MLFKGAHHIQVIWGVIIILTILTTIQFGIKMYTTLACDTFIWSYPYFQRNTPLRVPQELDKLRHLSMLYEILVRVDSL